MVFKYLTVVFFALVCKANRVNPVDCSDIGMYSGTSETGANNARAHKYLISYFSLNLNF